MINNYMKSAEIKIAQNPDMTASDKIMLINIARQKGEDLNAKFRRVNTVYITTDAWTTARRGLRAQSYIIDDALYTRLPYQFTQNTTDISEVRISPDCLIQYGDYSFENGVIRID